MNQMPSFECLNEFGCVCEKLRSGYGEFLSQGIRNLIEGTPFLQQLPDSESDWVETEADALFNIQKHCSIFRSSLANSWRDGEVGDRCKIAHICHLAIGLSSLSADTGQNRSGFSMLPKTISVAGISAEGISGKMIFPAFGVKPMVKLL